MRELHKVRPTAGTKQLEQYLCFSGVSTAEFFLAMISLLFRGEQGINWACCGPSSPGQISSPDTTFFKMKMASPTILFLGIPRQGQVVILHPAGLQIFPRRDALGLTRKWA